MKTSFLAKILSEIGDLARFAGRFFIEVFRPGFELREFLRQCFYIGYKSLPLVCITGFIMGLVITIQSRPTLVEFGAESWLPKMVSVSLIREIVPVITALICAGKIGSGIGAELGSMKVTEQIDAMDVSGTNPYKYLVVTRVLATTFMIPMLVIIADFISLYGSYLGANLRGVVSSDLSGIRFLIRLLLEMSFLQSQKLSFLVLQLVLLDVTKDIFPIKAPKELVVPLIQQWLSLLYLSSLSIWWQYN